MAKHLNIFTMYPGAFPINELLKKVDNTGILSPETDYGSDKLAENYLLNCDIALPPGTLDKLYFAMLVWPYKKNGKLADFRHLLTFCNLPTTVQYHEVKSLLEQRGYKFNSISDNVNLLRETFEWYHPLDLSKFEWYDPKLARKSGKYTYFELTVSM